MGQEALSFEQGFQLGLARVSKEFFMSSLFLGWAESFSRETNLRILPDGPCEESWWVNTRQEKEMPPLPPERSR